MAKLNAPYTNFNGGEVGKEIQARINLEGYAATASIMENWAIESEGPMGLRAGFEWYSQPTSDNAQILLHPFKYSVSQKALLLFSDDALRIAVDGEIVGRAAVTSTVGNGDMAADTNNLVAGLTPTLSQAAAAGSAAALANGDGATGYTSGATATQTITFDMTTAHTFNSLSLWGPNGTLNKAPGTYTFIGSNDSGFATSTTLVTVASSAAWTANERRSFSFGAVSFRYVRLSITAAQDATTGGYLLNEIAIHNGSWGDVSSGASSFAGIEAPGTMRLNAAAGGRAAMRVPVVTSSANVQHVLNIDVARGPVIVRVGTTAGGSEYFSLTARTGFYSIAFVPTSANYYVEVYSSDRVNRLINSLTIAADGDLVLETPWAMADLPSLRFVQIGDVVYVSSGVGPMKRIERYGNSSWALVDTDERGGPYMPPNLNPSFTLTPSATFGNISLTASLPLFEQGHVGALFQMTHTGQTVNAVITGIGQTTDDVLVTGIDNDRIITITRTGTFTGTLTLQRSVGNNTSFADTATTYTTAASSTFDDTFDNQVIYYRLRASSWTSGTATITISYSGGTTVGEVRITAVNSSTSAEAEVLDQIGAITATPEWAEGAWSEQRYWVKAIALFDGRLWCGATDKVWASVSDDYENHALGEDDADAIARNIATGDVNPIQWILSLSRLVFGTEGAEVTGREGTQDQLITGANLTLRDFGTQGSADTSPLKIDSQGVYVDRSTWRALLIGFDADTQNYGAPQSLMRLHRNLGKPGITQLAVSRQPETRLWMVRADGQLLTKAFTPGEAVLGWSRIITDGEIESVAVLPGDAGVGEDEIWVMVRRTVNSQSVRYLEKMDKYYYDSSAEANRLDSSVVVVNPGTAVMSAPHLKGRTVRVWADGARLRDRIVDASTGLFTIEKSTYARVVYGLEYTGRYRSSKLALGAQGGTALAQQGRPIKLIFGLLDCVANLEYGDTFDKMDQLADRRILVDTQYDTGPGLLTGETEPLSVPNKLGNDRNPMVCLRATGPAPIRVAYFVDAHKLTERI